jgi:hypothetical protein
LIIGLKIYFTSSAYKNGTNDGSLLAIMEEFEAKMMAKIKVHHEEMMAEMR